MEANGSFHFVMFAYFCNLKFVLYEGLVIHLTLTYDYLLKTLLNLDFPFMIEQVACNKSSLLLKII